MKANVLFFDGKPAQENRPAPGITATAIVDDLEAALARFAEIAADLKR